MGSTINEFEVDYNDKLLCFCFFFPNNANKCNTQTLIPLEIIIIKLISYPL
jgi:hypothetical protein